MINFKKILAIATTLIFITVLTACSTSKDTQNSSKGALSFGAMSSIEAVPFVIANEKGYFKAEGINVDFQIFKNSKDRDAALQAGNLDGIISDEVAVCLYQNADFDVKITGVTDGDFSLIANAESGIKSIKDISGKKVAISEKTIIEYTLDKILQKNSIKPEAVNKTIVPAMPTRLEMLRNNNVDAALLPEPFSTLALKDGGVLLGSASSLKVYSSITAFTQKSITAKGNDIKAFYRAYNKAVDYINNTPITEYEDTIIKTVGYPNDMKGKIKLPKYRKNVLPSEAEVKEAIDWTVTKGLVKKNLEPKNLMNNIGVE